MRKYLLVILLLFTLSEVVAQKKSVIILKSSSRIEGIKRNGIDILKVYNGIFQQDYSTLRSDSAYFYQAQNMFDAFGHVNISQGDTLNIYSDKLNYNGNTKIAILTENVSMVDKDATLTTNYLTYNTATRYGTYTGGGKLVNKDNVLTSKNGYYFANSRDSYFRYDVHLTTPDAFIVTDTLRYNSGTRIAYFYGPTNIYGKKGGKDNDTLYTENGLYNTITEQAFFGKKNLYKQGTKSLKGDSLFYDRKIGYGRAVKNITFNDNEQKMILKGDLGTYYKKDERTVVTENAYGYLLTEQKDTTKNDSLAKKGPLTNYLKNPKDTVKLLDAKAAKAGLIKPPPQTNTPATTVNKTMVNKPVLKPDSTRAVSAKLTMPKLPVPGPDTTASNKFPYLKKPAVKTVPPLKPVTTGSKGKIIAAADSAARIRVLKDTSRMKQDTIYYTADTLQTQIITYKALKDIWEKQRLANIHDTTAKAKAPSIVYKKAPKEIIISPPKWHRDSLYMYQDYFGKPKPPAPKKLASNTAVSNTGKKPAKQDTSLKKSNKPDSVYFNRKIVLADTTRVRILSAFHNAKIFKSDLQAKSDSAFYSSSDSTIRMYIHPIIWTQGSQLSGDTINLQMKNKKLDNMELFPAAFIVNIEKGDSVHFNQVSGKKMRGFFKDSKLDRMFVDGNAETIAFPRDSAKKQVTDMHRSLSSRIRINFRNSQLSDVTFLSKPEHRFGPITKFTDDDKVLKGFIWKPKERPVSKESIIPSLDKRNAAKKTAAKTSAGSKKPIGIKVKAAGDTTANKPLNGLKTGKDTSMAPPLNKLLNGLKTGRDTTITLPPNKPGIVVKKDSTAGKQPAIKLKTDSAAKKPDALMHKDTTATHH